MTEIAMPRYKSHKTVWALKIAEVINQGPDTTTDENLIVTCSFEDQRFAPLRINLRGKPTPEAGWYMVKYEDGYTSFSPGPQFEASNTPDPLNLGYNSFSQSEIDNWFSYHAPSFEQVAQYQGIRDAGKMFAETINRFVPSGADKTAAMRKVREAVMTANQAIACHVETVGGFTPRQEPLYQRAMKTASDTNV